MKIISELERSISVYEERDSNQSTLYSLFNPSHLWAMQELECALLVLLKNEHKQNLNELDIVDFGCGRGFWLQNFLRWGATPEKLKGIELLESRVEETKKKFKNVKIVQGSIAEEHFKTKSADIVTQFTVFSSILDLQVRHDAASQMIKLLKENGIIIWYDFIYNNPQNMNVEGIKPLELYSLFPNCEVNYKLITLAPPLSRPLFKLFPPAAKLLNCFPFLRTHILAVIKIK